MDKVLGIFAHCDDEVVCGWPVLQNNNYERHLFIIATRERGYSALRAICEKEGINLIEHVGFKNRFSSLQTNDVKTIIENAVTKVLPDFIFTHNANGEYGHIDHLYLHNLVVNKYAMQYRVVTSDIKIRSEIWPKRLVKRKGHFTIIERDNDFWDRCKAEYEKKNCWTTNKYIRRELIQKRALLFEEKYVNIKKKKEVVWLCDVHGWAFSNQVIGLSVGMPSYGHKMVTLKYDKKNEKFLFSDEDKAAINEADIVVAMTPAALHFTDRRDGIVVRASGLRSI